MKLSELREGLVVPYEQTHTHYAVIHKQKNKFNKLFKPTEKDDAEKYAQEVSGKLVKLDQRNRVMK